MTWSHDGEGEGGAQTEEAAMSTAITRAFRAIDEEVIGSVGTTASPQLYFAHSFTPNRTQLQLQHSVLAGCPQPLGSSHLDPGHTWCAFNPHSSDYM